MINKFENKKLDINEKMTDEKKSAKIEMKEFCYPQYNKTVKAENKKEADLIIKSLLKKLAK